MVDAAHLLLHLDEVKPDGVENEAVEQIAFADRIVLNKTDLVDDAQLALVIARIREVNRLAKLIPAQHAKIDLDRVLDVGAFDLSRALDLDPAFLTDGEHQHDQTVTSVGIQADGDVAVDRFNEWLGWLLATKGVDIFRSKGFLAVAGEPRRYVFQGVHMLFDGTEGPAWGDTPRHNRLVFIGRNLDRDTLESGFRACLAAAQ